MPEGWHTDPEELAAAIGPQTAAVLLMSPAMPTGALLGPDHLDALAEPVQRHRPWIVYNAAMERIRFDGSPPVQPAAYEALHDRTITVGSAAKEQRMIGWRVGWVVGPREIVGDIALVGLTNVVTPVGIAQDAVAAVLDSPDSDADVATATRTLAERARVVLDQLSAYACVPPHGGWSLLVDTAELGPSAEWVSDRLFKLGRVAATPMTHWGPSGARYLRLVFANEPAQRLAELGARFETALPTA
jgi:aspartate/methionine/tyrosine aminotransferase